MFFFLISLSLTKVQEMEYLLKVTVYVKGEFIILNDLRFHCC